MSQNVRTDESPLRGAIMLKELVDEVIVIPETLGVDSRNQNSIYKNGEWVDLTDLVDLTEGTICLKSTAPTIHSYASSYFDYFDNQARQMITDRVQLEFFERWLKKEEDSPDPKDLNLRQVYNAIVFLAMNGCG